MANFRNLPKVQSEVFEQIAISNDFGHPPLVLKALIKKGLIEWYEQETSDRFGKYTIYHYSVPLPIHIEWCEWCAREESDVQPT